VIREPGIVDGASAGRVRAVVQAEIALIAARDRLGALQEAALLHGGYDPDAYDGAVLDYREAREWAVTVRAAWRFWQTEHLPPTA
jgi:hypothetical protein